MPTPEEIDAYSRELTDRPPTPEQTETVQAFYSKADELLRQIREAEVKPEPILVSIPIELRGTPEQREFLRKLVTNDPDAEAAFRAVMTETATTVILECIKKRARELISEGKL